MDMLPGPTAATLVVTMWHEPHAVPFRARILFRETGSTGERSLTVSDPKVMLRHVLEWLSGAAADLESETAPT